MVVVPDSRHSIGRDGLEWTYLESGNIASTAKTRNMNEPEAPETTEGILDLLSTAPYGVYAMDMNQTIVFWNRSAEQILGHKASQVIGRRCYEVLQNLPSEGSTPVCMGGCPSIRLARERRVPPVNQTARMNSTLPTRQTAPSRVTSRQVV